jgi:hypothetical protein
VIISEPTLISHNGFLPDNMIPVGAPTSSLTEGVTEAEDRVARHQGSVVVENRNNATAGEMARMNQRQQQNGNELLSVPDSMINANLGTGSYDANYMPQRSLTTPSESLPVFSDAPSQLPSELDTDMDSNVMHEVEHVDTVIDTPLAGFTPEPFDLHAIHMLRRDGRTKSIESQRADTIDTGIELESEDAALTPGTTSVSRPEDLAAAGNHQFLDIPAKRKNYLSERSKLEQHYFPEERRHQQQQNNGSNQRNRDSGSVTPTLPTPNWSPSPTSTSPHSGRVIWGQHTTTSDSSPERQRRNVTPGTASSHSHPTPEGTRKNSNAPRSPKGARAFSINPQGAAAGYNNQNEGQRGLSSGQDNRRNVAPRSPKGARRMMVNQQQQHTTTGPPYPARQHSSLSGHSPERPSSFYPPSPHRSPTRQPRGAYSGYPSPPRPPERVHSLPQHIMPQHGSPRHSSSRGYPAAAAVHRSPPRQPRGASSTGTATSSYNNQTRDDGYGGGSGSLHDHDSRWDHWTAQNTQFNAAQAIATQLSVGEGGGGGVSGAAGTSGGDGANRNRRSDSSSGIHKEKSPAARSETSVDVDRNRSFMITRSTPKANPYYSPHVPKRRETDPAPHSVPQLRRMISNQDRPMNYQQQYSRHSGEYNRFSMGEFSHGGRMSESYPSPAINRNSAGPLTMGQRSPHYPRTPQGASAKAPRMVRSPPQKRLKSISPQRSITSYGSGVGGWLQGGGGGGGGEGASGRAMGASTASATSSRPTSLHSTGAFPPLQLYHQQQQQHQHHPGLATRYSDGASATAWVTPNTQWAARTQRMSSVQLHVPRSSAHESAV